VVELSWDVAIAGGGPGGSAAALSLRAYAPSLSVVLIEASAYDEARLGESLPPAAGRILDHLGLTKSFPPHRRREVHGTAAAWGAAALQENDFIYSIRGSGWHLDRPGFDALLAFEAAARGASRLTRTVVRGVERSEGVWRLSLSSDDAIRARFVVDATGRAATVARQCGARFHRKDRLVSFSRLFEDRHEDPRTVVEAWSGGFWYTAGLPGGRRLAACLTDADVARRERLSDRARWTRVLEATAHVSLRVRGAAPLSPLAARATESRVLSPPAGSGWLAVGDAASIFDPLSAQGITKAMRSGVFAAYAIGDSLERGDDSGLARYQRFVREEFASYLDLRSRYYRRETRWPDQEFWRRRRPA